MSRRLQTAKPKLALWMLVAVADMGLLVASLGVTTVLLALAGIAAATALAGGAVTLLRRNRTSPPSRMSEMSRPLPRMPQSRRRRVAA